MDGLAMALWGLWHSSSSGARAQGDGSNYRMGPPSYVNVGL